MRTGKFKLHRPELDPDPPKIERVVEDGQTYAVRNGSRFKIETLRPGLGPIEGEAQGIQARICKDPSTLGLRRCEGQVGAPMTWP